MATLRAGLIGLGMMGRHHARVMSGLPSVELVAVADALGDPHGAAGSRDVLRSIDELISVGLDYCVVAVPTIHHEEIALRLADAGVHTLVEKPLAHDLFAAQRVANAFTARGLVGAVGHVERYNPALQEARRRIEQGDLGALFQVTTRRQGPFPARIADVGVVKDLATHDIDLTAWITQQAYVNVSARTAHRTGRQHEDLVAATCSLSDGTVTNHLVNWLSPFKERVTVVTGEKGSFVADTLTADLTFHANGSIATREDLSMFRGVTEGNVIRYAIEKPEPLRREHEEFAKAVRREDADVVSMQDGLQTLAVADCILSSASTGAATPVYRL